MCVFRHLLTTVHNQLQRQPKWPAFCWWFEVIGGRAGLVGTGCCQSCLYYTHSFGTLVQTTVIWRSQGFFRTFAAAASSLLPPLPLFPVCPLRAAGISVSGSWLKHYWSAEQGIFTWKWHHLCAPIANNNDVWLRDFALSVSKWMANVDKTMQNLWLYMECYICSFAQTTKYVRVMVWVLSTM